jgi:hypothetical protein
LKFGKEMKPETARQLGIVLDGQLQKKQAATKAEDDRAMTVAKNLSDFSAKKAEVIKPAFEEIINMFKARGLNVYMREGDEERNSTGGTTPAFVSLEMYEQRPSGGMTPEFKIIFNKESRSLSLYTLTRSQGGPAGKSFPLDTITADWIQHAFLEYASRG